MAVCSIKRTWHPILTASVLERLSRNHKWSGEVDLANQNTTSFQREQERVCSGPDLSDQALGMPYPGSDNRSFYSHGTKVSHKPRHLPNTFGLSLNSHGKNPCVRSPVLSDTVLSFGLGGRLLSLQC